jgi:hypothetical protein
MFALEVLSRHVYYRISVCTLSAELRPSPTGVEVEQVSTQRGSQNCGNRLPPALRVLLPPHHGVVHTRSPDHQLVDNLPFPPPVFAALAATLATITAAMTQPETRPNTFGGKVWCSKGFPQCRCSAEAAGAPYSLTPSPLHSFTPSLLHSFRSSLFTPGPAFLFGQLG